VVSKFVKYSNWLVTALMLAAGIRSYMIIGSKFLNRPNNVSGILMVQGIIAGIVILTTVDVSRWEGWARSVGVVLSILTLLAALLTPLHLGGPLYLVLISVLILLIAWFYVPSVKEQFLSRKFTP
jgi:hypothetical protein